MRCFYLLLIITFFQSSAYSQDDVILPLSTGNYWLFEDSSKAEVTGDTTITYNNTDYKVYFWQWEESETKWLLRNQSDGLWAYGFYSTSDTIISPEILLRYPTFIGDNWQNNWSFAGDTVLVECTAVDTSVITSAGTFSSNEYYQNEQSLNKRSFQNLIFKIFSGHHSTITNIETQQQDGFYILFSPGIGYVQRFGVENNVVVNKNSLLSYNVITSIVERKSQEKRMILHQNYPNPFNPNTIIRFYLPKTEHVKVDIYNALGQKIKNILNQKIATGNHHVIFESGNIPSGIYFYKLTAGNIIQINKMLLVK